MINGIHLITYPDSLGRNISELHGFMKRRLSACVAGVHVLPFFPSTADRGFAPTTYREVDRAFGNWENVVALGSDFELTADFMMNHVSARSAWFLDWLERGEHSQWADLFIPVDSLFPDGVPKDERALIYTRKPRDPWVPVNFEDGSVRNVWCTFFEQQIDIDLFSDVGRRWLEEELGELCARRGIGTIRLDAIGYATKKRGTRFFFEEPEIVNLLGRCVNIAERHGVTLLSEVHEHFSYQERLAGWGRVMVYDFALPMLLLYACYSGNAVPLRDWLLRRPENCVSTLDTHDGIGVVDVKDLLSPEQIEFTVDTLYNRGSSVNRRYSTAAFGNLDIYQINCTYYSALGENDDAYMLARALQFFAPGIPQVYYVGLLAGSNDIEFVQRTQHGRDINRHAYSLEEAEAQLQRPVVRRLLRLMEFRSKFGAFGIGRAAVGEKVKVDGSKPTRAHRDLGGMEVNLNEGGDTLTVVRRWNNFRASLQVDFLKLSAIIESEEPAGRESFRV